MEDKQLQQNDTTYVIHYAHSDTAKETSVAKVKRLILDELDHRKLAS